MGETKTLKQILNKAINYQIKLVLANNDHLKK